MDGKVNDSAPHMVVAVSEIKVKRERTESDGSDNHSEIRQQQEHDKDESLTKKKSRSMPNTHNTNIPPVKQEKKRKRDMFSKLYYEGLRRKAMEDAAAAVAAIEQQQHGGNAMDTDEQTIAAMTAAANSVVANYDDLLQDQNNPRRKVYIIPRIMKTDIRRQYANMFANVYNSQDVELMQQFLTTFFRKDFVYSQTGRHYLDLQHAKICTIHDFKAVSEFWYEHMLDTPDLVFKLGKIQFKLKSDNTGTLTFQCSITGTRCSLEDRYQQELALFAKYNVQERVVDADRSEFVIDPFDTPISEPDRSLIPFVHQYPHTLDGSDIELSPYAFQGLLTFHLDECAKIFSSTFQLINFAPLPWDAV